ncbi:DUF6049 family protein [Bogoriella caseilytica]|uniref:Uncharacterized protein n=1 Tax=Bogoriella caseilytica TaxID=56055 RepID=A0A3N2BCH7_9MICO|nr:DUF6049 family protein [Bogoriella caseilytica]ROR72949.1 hypothetical protein EDD31_1313 [Bogoriella caseilytica]
MSARSPRIAALSVAALAAGLALPVAAGPALADDEPELTTLALEITELAPAVLTPDEPLVVSGTLTNGTTVDLIDAEIEVILQRFAPVSRTGAHQWLFGVEDSFAQPVFTEEISDLPAGEAQEFTLEIAPEELDLPVSMALWGPRGLEVAVDGDGVEDGADRDDEEDSENDAGNDPEESALRASDRSVTVWFPDIAVEPTPVAVAVPLVPLASERAEASEGLDLLPPPVDEDGNADDEPAADGEAADPTPTPTGTTAGAEEDPTTGGDSADGAPAEDPTPDQQDSDETGEAGSMDAAQIESRLSSPAAAAGRLTALVEALSHPGVTLATDPALLAPAHGTTSEDGAPAGPGAATEELAAALHAHATGGARSLALLPWADADVAALSRAGGADLTAQAYERGWDAAESAGISALPLIWPAGEADTTALQGGAGAGVSAALLPGEELAPTEMLTYTPTGRADIGEVEAVLSDPVASDILNGFLRQPGQNGPGIELSAINVRQMLLSDLAALARERPTDPRGVLLALDRDEVAALDAEDLETLSRAVAALAEAPWIEPTSVAELLAMPAPELDRADLPADAAEPGELDAEFLASLASTREQADTWSSVLDLDLAEAMHAAHAPLLSSAWREDPETRHDVATDLDSQIGSLDGGLTVLESSTLNVVSTSAVMPVNLSNSLPVPAHVVVELDPSDQRLQVDETVELSVPAQGQITAQVPVRAVGSGDVTLNVHLLSPAGVPVGVEQEMAVRVRADWETVGTAVIAGVLAVMLVIGLVRTVRRGRRMEPAS